MTVGGGGGGGGGGGVGGPGKGRGGEGRGGKGGGSADLPLWAHRALHSGSVRPVIPGLVRPVIWACQARPA